MQGFYILIMELFVLPDHNPIFYQYLWQDTSWALGFSISAFIIPILGMFLFYIVIDPPLGKIFHWLVSLSLTMLATFGIAFYNLWHFFDNVNDYGCIVNPEECGFLIDKSPVDNFFMASLAIAILGLLVSVVLSFLIKYFSTNNKKNPI